MPDPPDHGYPASRRVRTRGGTKVAEDDDILSTIVGKPTGTKVVTVERGQLALFADAVKE